MLSFYICYLGVIILYLIVIILIIFIPFVIIIIIYYIIVYQIKYIFYNYKAHYQQETKKAYAKRTHSHSREEFSNNLYKRLLKLITSIERLNLIELWKFILSIVGWIAFPFLKVCLVGGVEK